MVVLILGYALENIPSRAKYVKLITKNYNSFDQIISKKPKITILILLKNPKKIPEKEISSVLVFEY